MSKEQGGGNEILAVAAYLLLLQGVPKKLVRFAAKTTFFNTISLIALQTAQVFLGHSVLVLLHQLGNTQKVRLGRRCAKYDRLYF